MIRLIHRVWLGPHDPPAEHDYTAAWAATHPGWQLVTWCDELVDTELDLVAAGAYRDAPTYVHRADIALVEAIYAYGGVAVGYDMEPLRPIEPLIGGHPAWCTPDADGFPGQAFFGAAAPGHPAFRAVLDRITPRIAERGGWMQVLPGEYPHPGPHIDTGPHLWGDVFGRYGDLAAGHGLDILGDYRTAYPVRYWEKDLPDQDPLEYRRRRAHAVVEHKFAGTWLSDPARIAVPRG